jgi:hypothetical protein
MLRSVSAPTTQDQQSMAPFQTQTVQLLSDIDILLVAGGGLPVVWVEPPPRNEAILPLTKIVIVLGTNPEDWLLFKQL